MKKIFFTLFLCFAITSVFSQSITPNGSTEQCPGVNITFTVTIAAKSINSVMGGLGNPTVVQQPFNKIYNGGNITFSFVGKFADWNQNQVFNVSFINNNDLLDTHPFTFTKIKSLSLFSIYSRINPYISIITAPLCETQNFNISFPNVKYGNSNVTPEISYGTITNYEYQLPAGWKIGTTTSNGSNWIAGSNNVTVTSNLGTGNGQYVSIRPINTACGTGLAAGQISKILISRPAPVFTINGPQSFCSTATYSVPNLPTGATVSWSTTGAYSIVGSSTAYPVTVQSNSNGYGVLTANITTPSCGSYTASINLVPLSLVYTPYNTGGPCGEGTISVDIPSGNTFNWAVTGDLSINGGGQTLSTTSNFITIAGTSGTIMLNTSACGYPIYLDYNHEPYKRDIFVDANPMVGSDPLSASIQNIDYAYTQIKWYIDGVEVYNMWGSPEMFFDTNNPPCGIHTLSAKAVLECGATVDIGSVDVERYCSWWRSMAIYPNPASSHINIQPDAEKLKTLSAAEKREMKEYEASLYDISGKLLLKGKSSDYKLNLDTRNLKSDNYFIHIKIDGEKEIIKKQIIIRN